jgi:Spy/CpxP family protein refolding chaperone
MKTTMKLLLPLAGFALLAIPSLRADAEPAPAASARPDARPEMRDRMIDRMLERRDRRHEMGERMAKELGLSAEQKNKMKSLLRQQRDAAEAIMDDDSLSRDQQRTKLRELGQSSEAQRRAVLTPEQQKKADEMRARARERMEERRDKMEHRRERMRHFRRDRDRNRGRDYDHPRD